MALTAIWVRYGRVRFADLETRFGTRLSEENALTQERRGVSRRAGRRLG